MDASKPLQCLSAFRAAMGYYSTIANREMKQTLKATAVIIGIVAAVVIDNQIKTSTMRIYKENTQAITDFTDMKKLRTLSGQPLRSEFTALEAAVLIHAANYCVKDETFIGVPTSKEERYVKNQTEYKVTEFTEDDITVTIMTGKNAGKELYAVTYSNGNGNGNGKRKTDNRKTDNSNEKTENNNSNSNNTKKQTEMETTTRIFCDLSEVAKFAWNYIKGVDAGTYTLQKIIKGNFISKLDYNKIDYSLLPACAQYNADDGTVIISYNEGKQQYKFYIDFVFDLLAKFKKIAVDDITAKERKSKTTFVKKEDAKGNLISKTDLFKELLLRVIYYKWNEMYDVISNKANDRKWLSEHYSQIRLICYHWGIDEHDALVGYISRGKLF